MSNQDCHLVIGLPDTGKTTFLAALWHVVGSEEVLGALKLSRLEGDREYIAKIHECWIKCQAIDRTASGRVLPIELIFKVGNGDTSLVLPDVSGETFRTHLTERAWSGEYAELAAEASGALVFIHPDKLVEPTRIDEADTLINAMAEDGSAIDPTPVPGVPWSEDKVPTQVQLVELLQFHQHGAPNLRKVAVVISAWDRIGHLSQTPEKWLADRLPLLFQYFVANAEVLAYKIYGISAQGGDLSQDSERLLTKSRPSERIRLIDGTSESNDVSLPVRWLLEK